MESKFFKVSALTAAMLGAVAMPATAEEMNVSSPVIQDEIAFFNDSTISGNVNFFMRARDRAGKENPAGPNGGNDTKKVANLDHGSIFANLGFNSGYIADTVGLDLVVYSTFDMWQNASFDHEMNFVDCSSPYNMGSSCDSFETDNGVSYSTANLKFKFGENVNAKLGYFQPSVPSTLGVNWSFAPGTYRGGQVGLNFGDLALGAVFADEYKAPWFKSTYEFRDGGAWGPTGSDGTALGKDVGEVYSVGARYTLANGVSIDAAFGGLTDGDRKNAHIKVKGTTDGGFYWSPQVYMIDDKNQYDDTAFQLAFLSSFASGPYSFRAETTYTMADSTEKRGQVGNFAYRLTEQYGGSNGAYDIWWNNRSDYNHDGELALFGSMSRDFADIGATGLNAGVSAVYGFGAKSKQEGIDELKEYAFSLFTSYAIQNGALKDANISMHYTQYYNDTNAADWGPYSNGFNDEKDFKLILTMPFGIK
ncbi:outer membrane porin, OprD family [Photobacterium angustum]|uniref:Outer membrane porin, OprD family n=1 Tax=Photobacterium angustum TaxID=661 RepID=A0A855SIY0_PHOAN|nr:OprD family outer membrane porin [Photobacterium angustum]KJF82894.1 multidrug transporter [Photobacterium damselae subsp. damselae]KJG34839.1 multidrug transporter [Photobacterium angustum]KJG42245.1 multidrug transporter [Photobacterium angustum]KJG47033.1 multidrug transporter [Photobacterium angustum]KJG50999.1 multidrug transporter [Photobacterium angustum]